MTSDFFNDRKAWSIDKHSILGSYAVTAARILNHLTVVDLMAGAGIYDDGAPGSPLIVMEKALEAQTREFKYSIKGVFTESDMYSNLMSTLDRFPLSLWSAFKGDWQSLIHSILKELGNDHALVFADPYGAKGIEWQALSQLINRPDSVTEVLVNFNIRHFRRLAGFLESDALHRDRWLAVVDRTMGDTHWQQKVDTNADSDKRDAQIVEEYLSRLRKKGGFKYTETYPVNDPETGRLKYYLVYGTRHIRGLEAMNDVVVRVYAQASDRRQSARLQRGFQASLMFEEPQGDIIEELAEAVRAVGTSSIQFRPLRRRMIQNGWFGKASSAELRRAVRLLISRGQVEGMNRIADSDVIRFKA